METKELWSRIINYYKDNPQDVKTVPVNKNISGKWFYVYVENNGLYVESGKEHPDKSNITGRRRLQENDLETIYRLYNDRKKSRQTSREAQEATRNSSYWYGIFNAMDL